MLYGANRDGLDFGEIHRVEEIVQDVPWRLEKMCGERGEAKVG